MSTPDETADDLNVEWPVPFDSANTLPPVGALVIAWKPLIDGWDIVLGRKVAESPSEYTHWLPMLPRPATKT